MTVFGQLVVGAPGAGKSTYCEGMRQYLTALGRKVALVNLDPANDEPPYAATIDLRDLVELTAVMEEFGLGPNGGLVYCLEYLELNMDWLQQKLEEIEPSTYVIFDFPGQLELFTHCKSIQNIAQLLSKDLDFRLCAINLIDAHHCSDASNFISASMLSLMMMLRLELPHVNVLSKVDLIERFGALPFNLEFFMDQHELERLIPYLDAAPDSCGEKGSASGDDRATLASISSNVDPSRLAYLERRRRLHGALCELLSDFSLVTFETLDISSAESVGRVLSRVDKANGYVFQGSSTARGSHRSSNIESEQEAAGSLFSKISSNIEMNAERTLFVQEKYTSRGKGGV